MRRLFLPLVLWTACTYNYDELRAHRDGAADHMQAGPGGSAGGSLAGVGGRSSRGGAGGDVAVGGKGGGTAGAGAGGTPGTGGTAGKGSGNAGTGGAAGLTGKGGGSGGSNVDASCSLVTDALFDHSTTTCGAMFNFESGFIPTGTSLPGGSNQAFTMVSVATTPHTYCGTWALAIGATFSGTTGTLTKGEVDIPLDVDSGTANLSGKTLTVHVSASPAACGEDLRFKVALDTTTGNPTAISLNTVTANYTTASASLATVAGAGATNALAIEAFSVSGYTGTIYVDEIDIK